MYDSSNSIKVQEEKQNKKTIQNKTTQNNNNNILHTLIYFKSQANWINTSFVKLMYEFSKK